MVLINIFLYFFFNCLILNFCNIYDDNEVKLMKGKKIWLLCLMILKYIEIYLRVYKRKSRDYLVFSLYFVIIFFCIVILRV